MKKYWWESSSGRVAFQMTMDQARRVSGTGDMYSDTAWLVRHELRPILKRLRPRDVREALKDYGAWSPEELRDHKENLIRLVWIAGNDIAEQNLDEEVA